MSLAIVPGSFDPMTLGHRALIESVAKRYDRVVVAVMVNDQKQTMFDMDIRVKIASATLSDLTNVSVISDTGMLYELYKRLSADAVCKGYRNPVDYEYEMTMAEWNRARLPEFHTELLPSSGEYADLSSTTIRRELQEGREVSGIHPNALHLVCEAYRAKQAT